MTTIWFNEGYAAVRDAVLMIGEARGSDLRILASHRDPYAPVLDAADTAFIEPEIARKDAAGIAAYADYCLEACARRKIDLFVAQRGRTAMAARRADFERIGTKLALTGAAETLALVDDKSRFYEAALAAGIPMPWTRKISDVAGFDAALAALAARGLAACVKPPQGVFGAGFWQLDTARTLFETLMDADSHRIAPAAMRSAIAAAPPGFHLLVLEFLGGDEWSLDCIAREGRMVVGVARRKLGRAQRLETEGPMFAIAAHAIAAFGLSGLINLQFRAASHDAHDVRLLEINARMSGGCVYTRYSGVNLPWWHVALELGSARETDVPVPVGGALVAAIAGAQQIAYRVEALAHA